MARRLGRAVGVLVLAILVAFPVWSYLSTETVSAPRTIVGLMAAVAAVSPASALLLCAGVLPLTGPLSASLGTATLFTLGEPLVVAFLAGWLLRVAVWPGPPTEARIRMVRRPALVLAVVVAASGVVRLSAVQPTVAYPWPFAGMVFRFLYTDFFRNRATFGAIADAAFFLEGLGLFVAGVTLVGQNRALGHRLLTMVTCGAAGVAALNIGQLLMASLSTGDVWDALVRSIHTIRITAAFPDLNAAGSYLAMDLLLSVGLAFAALGHDETGGRAGAGHRLGLLWLPVVPVLAIGLWLTGSRTALVAVVPAAFALLPVVFRAPRWAAWGAIGAAVLAVALSLPLAGGRFSVSTETRRPVRVAVNYR
ncbi:MAG TPA: hypothetical protein VF332_02110, partial [Vicinamibacterales bacterium]